VVDEEWFFIGDKIKEKKKEKGDKDNHCRLGRPSLASHKAETKSTIAIYKYSCFPYRTSHPSTLINFEELSET
jgi:hypothetical protein